MTTYLKAKAAADAALHRATDASILSQAAWAVGNMAAELVAQGFEFNGADFRKEVATGGMFGSTTMIIRIDATGRWLERIDGWGDVIRDVDLRKHQDGASAVAAVME